MNSAEEPRKTREVVYRAVLAPDRIAGDWTVDDLRKFVEDCDAQGIPGDTRLQRERPHDCFEGPFVAERTVSL